MTQKRFSEGEPVDPSRQCPSQLPLFSEAGSSAGLMVHSSLPWSVFPRPSPTPAPIIMCGRRLHAAHRPDLP